jgi:predicted RNA binding protein YcfA (HicA-like mRNA interferase family)
MTQKEKLIRAILDGLSDKNIDFNELCNLLKSLGFGEHIRGNHHIFRKEDVVERINLQKDGTKAKAYQVKQVRNLLLKYKLGSRWIIVMKSLSIGMMKIKYL